MDHLIFGGSGFIGSHLTKYIANKGVEAERIYNFDIKSKRDTDNNYQYVDVRQPIPVTITDVSDTVIYNLAAVHTTPGHPDAEYFETNILGAENVCDFARENKIDTIVFTSSIAPYSASEELKTEDTLPMPKTPYGISKLNAEYIHKLWQAEDPANRKLIIVRPGVVFGKNENANFTRLYHAIKKGFFFYPGRKDTIKAAVYVKDVARILYETSIYEGPGVITLNLTYFPAPTIEEICNTIACVTKVKPPKLVVPPRSLKLMARLTYGPVKMLGLKISGIHPERVEKLMVSTNISGEKLSKSRYCLQYSLKDAIQDWFDDCEKQGLN